MTVSLSFPSHELRTIDALNGNFFSTSLSTSTLTVQFLIVVFLYNLIVFTKKACFIYHD